MRMPCAFEIDDILGETLGCQFGVGESDLIEFGGKAWCRFHLPLQVGETGSEKAQWDVRRSDAFNEEVFEFIDRVRAVSDEVNLSGVVFPGAISFERYVKDELPEVSFRRARFGKRCDFDRINFAGSASFKEVRFTGDAWFSNANFSTLVYFDEIVVAGTAWFSGTTFGGNARFLKARFGEKAYFSAAIFAKLAEFHDAIFEQDVTFSDAVFSHAVYFRPTTFKGNADFSGSLSSKEGAECRDAFPKLATFHRSRFGGRAVFINRRFLSTTVFGGVVFEVAPEFHNAVLHQDTSFSGTQFLDKKGARGVDAARAYRTLKLAMESARARDEEARFYAYEQQSLRNRKDTARSIKMFSWLYEKTANYGQSFLRPLAWLSGTFVAFLLVYFAALSGPTITWADFEAVLRFGLQQVFYPFAAFRLEGTSPEGVGGVPLWLAFVAAAQSLLTITFLALFFLALRRRFKLD